MPTIASSTLMTPRVRQWLRKGLPARVLHRFEDVCNLVNDQGEVISLVTPRIGPGPFAMVLAGDLPAELDLQPPIAVDDGRKALTVGSLSIRYGEATLWNSRPDWERIRSADRMSWPPPLVLKDELDSFLTRMLHGIVTDHPAECMAGVTGLAGRGTGLTPSGDDVLMGVLYALWVWYPNRDWMAPIMETAAPRTTTLSANFIRAAANGEAVWQWHALAAGQEDAIAQIHRIGHRSGAEAWAGFVHTGQTLGKSSLQR